ncbi:MAG: 3-deoxy-manno-octulosonate cytidylyltransferase [Gemmatimonadota bacterium]
MADARVLGVIPARLASERLERKPLVRMAGRPLIEWVWRRVRTFDVLHRVTVATDAREVAEACRAFGAPVVMTDSGHASGTARVAEVASRPAFTAYDIVVNVQGDEPFMTEEAVAGAVERVRAGFDVGTAAAPLGTPEAWRDPAVVKVVCGDGGRALYFSRAPIPYPRDGAPSAAELASGRYLRHVGVYAYTADALTRWVELPPSGLERIERLEQLRPLSAGALSIGVAVVEPVEAGIDTPEDVRRAEVRLQSSGESSTPSRM